MRRDEDKAIHWVACCVLAATLVACGGGSIGIDDPSAGIPMDGVSAFDNNTSIPVGSGGPLTVTRQGTRIIFTSESGGNVMWAVLREADKLIIGWSGSRYVYEHSAAPPTKLQPDGKSGTLLVGGEVAGGAQIGLPNHQISGRVEPSVLIINGLSSSDNTEVEYLFSSCDQALCEGGPANTASKTIATNVPVDLEGALRATFAKQGTAGQIMFTVARTDVVTSDSSSSSSDDTSGSGGGGYDYDDTPTNDDTSGGSGGGGSMDTGEQTNTNQDTGGSGNTTPPAKVKKDDDDDDDNDWVWWVVGGAAVLGGAALLAYNWDDWFGDTDYDALDQDWDGINDDIRYRGDDEPGPDDDRYDWDKDNDPCPGQDWQWVSTWGGGYEKKCVDADEKTSFFSDILF